MKTVAFFVGLAAVALYLLGYLQKRRKSIMVFNVTSRGLYILQYILLGAYEGAVLDIAGILSSLLAGKKQNAFIQKHIKLVFICVNILILIMGLTVYKDLYSLLPIAGVLLHTGAFWINDEKRIRQISLAGCPCWFIYNFVSGAYGSCIGDVLSAVSIVISMVRYDFHEKNDR